MATDNSTKQECDTKPYSQITSTGQQASLPTKYLDAKDVDYEVDKADTKIDLQIADTRRTPETQGSNLPKLTQVMITKVPRRLKHNPKNPEQWVLQVKVALAQLRLEHLINSSVPRPAKGRHNYNRWVQWSCTVANWLYLQVDENIQERLQQRRKISSKADAFFDGIMKTVRQSDNAVNLSAKGDGAPNPRIDPSSATNRACAPLATDVVWDDNGEWAPPPQGTRLSDELVYIASKNMSNKQLCNRFPLDFDGNGLLRTSRTPQDPAPLIWAHGLPFVVVARTVALTGLKHAHLAASWLDKNDANVNQDSQKKSDFEAVRRYIAAHQSQYHLLGSNLLPISSLR